MTKKTLNGLTRYLLKHQVAALGPLGWFDERPKLVLSQPEYVAVNVYPLLA